MSRARRVYIVLAAEQVNRRPTIDRSIDCKRRPSLHLSPSLLRPLNALNTETKESRRPAGNETTQPLNLTRKLRERAPLLTGIYEHIAARYGAQRAAREALVGSRVDFRLVFVRLEGRYNERIIISYIAPVEQRARL